MRGGIACECVLIGSRRCARVPRLGAAGEVARWFETPVAFARLYPCGIETAIAFARLYPCGFETAIAFARLYPCGIETAIAFAGEKWAFLVRFLGAEVMAVSVVPCWE